MPAKNSIEHNHEATHALPEGLSVLKSNPLPLMMGGLAEFFTWAGALFLFQVGANDFTTLGNILFWLIGLAVCALLFVINCWIRVGYINTQQQSINGTPDLFDAFILNAIPRSFLKWRLITFGVQIGTAVIAFMPGFCINLIGGILDSSTLTFIGYTLSYLLIVPTLVYVRMGLIFGDRLVVLGGYEPKIALRRSYDLAKKHVSTLLLFMFVAGAMRVFGAFFCGIGIVFADMILDISLTKAYVAARSNIEEQGYQK